MMTIFSVIPAPVGKGFKVSVGRETFYFSSRFILKKVFTFIVDHEELGSLSKKCPCCRRKASNLGSSKHCYKQALLRGLQGGIVPGPNGLAE